MPVITYKCVNCGGPLKFNADTQNWKCEFCLSIFQDEYIKKAKENESKQSEEFTEEGIEFEENARAYICTSCGAEIVTDETTAATFCYYCHNPAIIPARLSGKYRPAKVIPFKFNREVATEKFTQWCRKKPLLSKKFTSSSQLELLTGIYIPFWLFDCNTKGKMYAKARKTRTWTSGRKRYTEIKHYSVTRAAIADFKGIPADGSRKADDELMETIEPYDYTKMEDFAMPYLSGYLAEKYDLNQDEVYYRIHKRVQEYKNSLLRNSIKGYDGVTVKSCNIDVSKSNVTYVLLPTWMFTYNYDGKTYMFAMNGQTGKIAGNLPNSKGRMVAYFAVISSITFILLFVGGMFL